MASCLISKQTTKTQAAKEKELLILRLTNIFALSLIYTQQPIYNTFSEQTAVSVIKFIF